MAAPTLRFHYTRASLSQASGYDSVTVTFASDMAYTAFECRATKCGAPCGRGVGLLVAAFAETPADTERSFAVYGAQLTNGDGAYRISLYAQGADGSWNDNASFVPSGSDALLTTDGDSFLCMN